MEKKRRERINNCLDELKQLILASVKDEVIIILLELRTVLAHAIINISI